MHVKAVSSHVHWKNRFLRLWLKNLIAIGLGSPGSNAGGNAGSDAGGHANGDG